MSKVEIFDCGSKVESGCQLELFEDGEGEEVERTVENRFEDVHERCETKPVDISASTSGLPVRDRYRSSH